MKIKTGFLGALMLLAAAVNAANAPDNTLRVSGTILDAAGKPLAGATVELYQFGPQGFPAAAADMKPQQTATTGTNGAYEFRAPPVATVIFAQKPGLAPAWASYWRAQTDLTDEQLTLTTPGSVTGMVVDDADKPVGDALVYVTTAYSESPMEGGGMRSGYISSMPMRDRFSARSGPDGKFRIDGCPTNAAMDLAVRKEGKVLRELSRQFVSPETMRWRFGKGDVKLVLDTAGAVEGKVRSRETGQPLPEATISLQPQQPGPFSVGPEPARATPDGAFHVGGVAPGSYRVRATFGTNAVPDYVAENVAVNVEAGKTTRDIEISATTGGFLEVAALGKEDRKPLPQVNINAFGAGYLAGNPTGTDGRALFRMPPGQYKVTGYRENARSEQVSASVEAGKTNRVEIEIAQPVKISGTVRDPAGAPVAGIQLRVVPTYRANVGLIKTDAEGQFEFPWNPQQFGGQNNTCSVVARDPKRNLAAAAEIEEGATKIELRLQPGLTIAGQVEDAGGKPLASATATLYFWSGNTGDSIENKPAKTDARGKFEITALPRGCRYSVHATAKGYGSGDSQTQSTDTDTDRLDLPTFTLAVADQKLAGQVVDADDKPVSGAWVNIYGRGQPNGSLRTDDQGRFRFEEVCEGRIQISASSQNSYGNVSAEAGDTNVVLKLGVNQSFSSPEAPRRASLKGKPLPDLAPVGFQPDNAPAGKPILLCLFDIDQRPSRRFTRLLAEQCDALRQKGLTVLGLQAAVTSAEALKEWKDANSPPFPIGLLPEKNDKTKWAAEVQSMPWLILTDADHRVTAEGFTLEEIDARLKDSAK